jgi:uncharacterized protein YqjF (DUF2071 family)
MTVKEILGITVHRTSEFPSGNWKYYQEWDNAVFLHWQVEPRVLEKFVPTELEIDLYENKAWVSLVVFGMEKIKARNLPSFPPISDFEEINIRTYVRHKDKQGVYFLSIEGSKKLSCKVAKRLSELPYRHSNINRTEYQCSSSNRAFKDSLELKFQIGEQTIQKSNLDKWLLERYALFQDAKDSINEFDIHHVEWPVFDLVVNEIKLDYPRFNGLLNNSPDKIHFSTGVQVIAWDKKKNKRDLV